MNQERSFPHPGSTPIPQPSRTATGIPGLDDVLHGGLPSTQMYLLEGNPGTGKTTIAMQFVLEGRRLGQSCLYITLSESRRELEAAAGSHGWSLDGVSILEFIPEEAALDAENHYTVFHPSEVELATTIKKLLDEIERINPERVVLDSLSEFRLLAADPVRYRRQLLALKRFFSGRRTTTLMLDDRTGQGHDLQLQSIAHGVLRLECKPRSYGVTRRQIEILKIRGAGFREGLHDYSIDMGGVTVYPRLIASEHHDAFAEERLPSDIAPLDTMFGGGIERGSSILVMGPTGVGKSSIILQYAVAAAKRGERTVVYSFDESVRTATIRAGAIGLKLAPLIDSGTLALKQVDPAEMSPGQFVGDIRREVEERNARVVILDSLNGFMHSMPGETDLALSLHELLTYLGQKGVATFLVLTQHGVVGEVSNVIDISYLADTVLVMRYFETAGEVRRALSVVKKRSGAHENTIREISLSGQGIHIGEPLINFKGVLSGMAQYQDATLGGHGNGRG